jgi:urease accessory protein
LDKAPIDNGVSDRRGAAVIGRCARLELAFEARHGRTVLARGYAEPPLRIGRTFEIDGAAYLILVCSGPGVFAGDDLRLVVHVGAGARVVLTSQSALQVHPSAAPAPAVIRHDYIVDAGAELVAHWDPVIPFAGARLDQRFDLCLNPGGRLYWSDALMAGRVTRAEAWQFEALTHHLEVRVGGLLEYLERYTITPAARDVPHPWVAAGHGYMASAVTCHERATAQHAECLQRAMDGAAGDNLRAGVDLVDRLLVARLLSSCGAAVASARSRYRQMVLSSIFERPLHPIRK